jgi:hypothetical protein
VFLRLRDFGKNMKNLKTGREPARITS